MQHPSTPLPGRLRWGAIALATAAVMAVGGPVAAAGITAADRPASPALEQPSADPYHTCLRAGPTTPDRLEARAAECRLRTNALHLAPAYVECLRNAAGTADAMDRRAAGCVLVTQP
jgi:hypothetical protein